MPMWPSHVQAARYDVGTAITAEVTNGHGNQMQRLRVNLPGREVLLAIVLKPDDAGAVPGQPIVCETD